MNEIKKSLDDLIQEFEWQKINFRKLDDYMTKNGYLSEINNGIDISAIHSIIYTAKDTKTAEIIFRFSIEEDDNTNISNETLIITEVSKF